MKQNIILSLILFACSSSSLHAQISVQNAYADISDKQHSLSPFYPAAEPDQQMLKMTGLPFINRSDSEFSQPATTDPGAAQELNNESFSETPAFEQPSNEGPDVLETNQEQQPFQNPDLPGQSFDQPQTNRSKADSIEFESPDTREIPVR